MRKLFVFFFTISFMNPIITAAPPVVIYAFLVQVLSGYTLVAKKQYQVSR